MRQAVVALMCACSFPDGHAPGDAGRADGDAPDAPVVRVTSPRKLVFDNSAATVDFGPHPVLVALDATKIDYSIVADPNTNLRFEFATNGNLGKVGDNVPFEVEKWDPSGESIVWIRVPEILHGTTDTAVLMHFGPEAAGSASAAATWTNWELVNHMAPGLNSSIGAFPTVAINMTFAPGQFGDAAVFSDTGDHRVTFANNGTTSLFNGWSLYFLSFWIYVDYSSAADLVGEPRVMDKGTSISLGRLFPANGNINFQLDQHFTGSNNDVYLNTVVPPKTWTNIALVFDNYGAGITKNGVAGGYMDLTSNQQTLLSSTQDFYLGNTSNVFRGMIDELRIERRSRVIDFVRAQYLIGTRKFVTFTDP